MAYISQYQYYNDSANFGSYQYVSLFDIVNNFLLIETGNHSLVNNEPRYKILFHAKKAIQELNYDAFKEIKVLQLNIDEDLRFILPPDYVNWVRISLFKDGWLRPLTENIQVNYATQYLQNSAGTITFDVNNNIQYVDPSMINQERLNGTLKTIYLNDDSPFNGQEGWFVDGNWYFTYNVGARFGLNTETANFNPTFRIDNKSGVINFNSDMAGESCVLEYVSDGMENGDDSQISVNKMFEDYIYAEIKYRILRSKLGVQQYIINEAKKVRRALYNNAKIRISNISPSKLLMSMRGIDKVIK
jgi:hypothetical protein